MTEQLHWVNEAWQQVTQKINRTSKTIGANFPHASENGKYLLAEPHWWTAGFWPGLLWLVYQDTQDAALKQLAEDCEAKLDAVQNEYYRLDHDMGFMWTLTSVAQYKLLGNEDSKRRALLAANLLMGRFNVNGNFIRAWNPWTEGEDNSGVAIIDCMMNLPLLYWASEETGDPRFKSVAKSHADTVLEYFIRNDGSVHHIVRFDPESGNKVEALGGQGYGPDSAWSRGTAWAIYGLTLCYHYTKEAKYLETAKRVAHFFISHLPEDFVPDWDFRLPADSDSPKDSSAGAIAASGLLLLANKVTAAEAPVYKRAGEKILESLYRNYGNWDGSEEEGLILHGTSHFPEGKYTDNPLIYGDYYFVEGLARLKGYKELFW
ncbi:unsaturated chondroitin disaccharide hydrolase [Neobacillus bataviensis]|uniref:Unsaturated chondroitin disaccharide hydrolase n=1 Tax=Neobacillus bataviensis TaxID=220685 RepID=A0A561CX10_9BACI|nr:glycoside hydrolase family 88 protein [Neobacillus bataviensis]TWD95736.1 unsaturated chondroitin disaccharide hydrolase [Neobacillus bataviensis]